MQKKLMVALDFPAAESANAVFSALAPLQVSFKVGLELFCAEGPEFVQSLVLQGSNVFLDLKLHDIPNTVARAVRTVAQWNIQLLTIHAAGGKNMVAAAVRAARETNPSLRIIAVTVLTSLDDQDLADAGVQRTTSEQALRLAELALHAGADGVVCSPLEVAAMRSHFGKTPLLVVPGIRPSGAVQGDQKRIATPAQALRDGASYLVVGRPITEAPNPQAAASAILEEMMNAEE